MKREEEQKKRFYTVYRILTNISELTNSSIPTVIYIGVTSTNLSRRLLEHAYKGFIQRYLEKNHITYSMDFVQNHFRIEPITILYTDYISACNLEKLFTEDYIRNNFPLQNQKYGNVASKKLQEKINKKSSIKLRGNKNQSSGLSSMPQSTRDKISKTLKGNKLSQETKDKISNSLKGRQGPNKGKKLSEEWKKRISKAGKGRKASKKTIQMTIERNKDRCRKIIELDTNIVYKNIMEAAKELNIHAIEIRHMLHQRKINFYNGYTFMFYDEYIRYIEEIKNKWIIE